MKRLLLLLLLVAGCVGVGSENTNQYFRPEQAQFFEGYEGVEVEFDQVPTQLYYSYNPGVTSNNEFPFGIRVRNLGASVSYGAVFISGFDPHVIKFYNLPLDYLTAGYGDACVLSVGNYFIDRIDASVSCAGLFLHGSEDDWLDTVSVYGSKLFGNDLLANLGVTYVDNGQYGGKEEYFVNFNIAELSYEQREHGRLLAGMLSGLDIARGVGQSFILAGDTYEYPGGELLYVDWDGYIADWPLGADEIEQDFLVTSCYSYTTFAAPLVCIDPQPYSVNRKVCSPQQYSYGRGQGAPLAITSVVQENTPRKAIFHITVENKGGGTVFNPGALEKCNPYFPGGARSNDLDMFWIGQARINNQLLICTPRFEVRMQNNRASFTCSYDIVNAQLSSAYQTSLVLELYYGYSKTMQRTIPIKRVT